MTEPTNRPRRTFSPQERLESSPAGRLVISAFLVLTLAAVLVINLPESRLRRDAMKAAEPYLIATGLDQNWRIFAPPRRTSLRVEARVTYEDGSVAIWRPPGGGDLLGAYWDYRWRKWLENVTQDVNRKVLWRPAALFAARELRRPGKVQRSVTLIRSWQDLRAPGRAGPDRRRWRSYAYYTVPASELSGE
jgi:hypothetical protein